MIAVILASSREAARNLLRIAMVAGLIVTALLSVHTWGGGSCGLSADQRLLTAAYLGDMDEVQHALRAGASCNARDDRGWTVLTVAVAQGQVDIVRHLLAQGADVNAVNPAGDTALVFAAWALKGERSTEALLAAGADPNFRGAHHAPLISAALNGREDVVQRLLAARADVNLPGGRGQTALMVGAAVEDPAIVRRLLAAGAQVNAANHDGQTALMAAAEDGNAEVVRTLMAAGARTDLTDATGRRAVDLALIGGHRETAKLLEQRPPEPKRDVTALSGPLIF